MGKRERTGWGFDGGWDHLESREKTDYFHSGERDCIKLNCHGLAKAPCGQVPPSVLFCSAPLCTNETCWKQQQVMGASPLLFPPTIPLPLLISTKKMHHTPGSPGVRAQPPTGKNKSAPTTGSESTEIGEHARILP